MKITPIKTSLFNSGGDLPAFIFKHIPKIKEQSVIAVTSKIVSLAENQVVPGNIPKQKYIEKNNIKHIKKKSGCLVSIDGLYMNNAGIDKSNADGNTLLLPKDSFKSAYNLRLRLMRHYEVEKLGVLVCDSWSAPLRFGVIGVSLGYAGFKGLRDYRGAKDLFGRPFKYSISNVADSLACIAVLVMGEGSEQTPLAIIEKAPVEFADQVNRGELRIDPHDDYYRPIFDSLDKIPAP